LLVNLLATDQPILRQLTDRHVRFVMRLEVLQADPLVLFFHDAVRPKGNLTSRLMGGDNDSRRRAITLPAD
jgi:hypothetical protein